MNLKLSHYVTTVPIELENQEIEQYILYSSRTSEVLLASAAVYEKITNKDFLGLELDTLEKLMSTEMLVDEEENELKYIISYNQVETMQSDVLYQVIQPTANCQLGCGYCGQVHTKSLLSKELYGPLLERIENRINPNHKTLQIGWFGSEPLMALTNIRELSPLLFDLADKHSIGYYSKIVTNALSLKKDIFLELVQQHKITQIEVTLDGTAEYHDKRRHTKENYKTFDIIWANLLSIFSLPNFEDYNCRITIRCNVDRENQHSVIPLIQLIAENGLQDKIAGFYVAPIHSWGNDAHLRSLTKEEFANLQIDWYIEMYRLGFDFGLLPGRVTTTCMAVDKKSEMFDAYGNVFNCTEVSYVPFYENSPYVLGNLKNPETVKVDNDRPLHNWFEEIESNTSNSPCHSCKILPICGGACPKSWKEGIPVCPSLKFNIQDRLLLSYLYTKSDLRTLINA